MIKCCHEKKEELLVTFKDGTKHIQKQCIDCGKKLGYASKAGRNLQELKEGKTTSAERESLGLFVGCMICGEKSAPDGFCRRCRTKEKEFRLRVKQFCKEKETTVWKLSKEQLLDLYAHGRTR